jgi:hypothetical protein
MRYLHGLDPARSTVPREAVRCNAAFQIEIAAVAVEYIAHSLAPFPWHGICSL